MSPSHCLNCNTALVGEYCHKCGQPASTHRLSLKHFIAHDLVHGVWHVDRGILYTLRELFLRPGQFAHEYVEGKRAGHFNVVTLLLLVFGLMFYVAGFNEFYERDIQEELAHVDDRARSRIEVVRNFFETYAKWLLLSLVPIASISSFLVFRKKKYYYTEHLVINSYFFAGFIIILTLFNVLLQALISGQFAFDTTIDVWLSFLFFVFCYWQAWKLDYSFAGWLWRLGVFISITTAITAILSFSAVFIYWVNAR